MMRTTHLVVFVSVMLTGVSCGAGKAGEAVRPKDLTYAAATGGEITCHEVGAEGTPLVVDWKDEERGDLEVATKQGVAIVHYDCNAIKVLTDCHVEGTYGFIGMTRKEQVISLENSDLVKANLPLNGASLGASLERGSALDIGLVMVGKKTTTVLSIEKSQLVGRCDGATHFVHGATLGAFAMQTRTAGAVSAVAEVFGMGASAASSSKKLAGHADGSIEACRKSDVDATAAPKECGALLRVQLLALSDNGASKPASASDAPKEVSCPKGLVATDGKCTTPAAAPSYDCALASVAECTKQCDLKNASSCAAVALFYTLGMDVPVDPVKSAAFQKRACDAGDQDSCVFVGENYQKGEGVTQDKVKAMTYFETACNAGNSNGCRDQARMYFGGRWGVDTPDPAKAVKTFLRACDAGAAAACAELARVYDRGDTGITPDKSKALPLYARACDAKDPYSCTRVGQAFFTGEGGLRVNKPLAAKIFQRACDGHDENGCAALGVMLVKGDGVPADAAKGKALLKKSCSKKIKLACDQLADAP